MKTTFTPCFRILFGQSDYRYKIQEGEKRGKDLYHISDDGNGQIKNNGNNAQDIHKGQNENAGSFSILFSERTWKPAVITGLADRDGIISKAGIQGGQQRHNGAADDEEVKQPGGENTLRCKNQSG